MTRRNPMRMYSDWFGCRLLNSARALSGCGFVPQWSLYIPPGSFLSGLVSLFVRQDRAFRKHLIVREEHLCMLVLDSSFSTIASHFSQTQKYGRSKCDQIGKAGDRRFCCCKRFSCEKIDFRIVSLTKQTYISVSRVLHYKQSQHVDQRDPTQEP